MRMTAMQSRSWMKYATSLTPVTALNAPEERTVGVVVGGTDCGRPPKRPRSLPLSLFAAPLHMDTGRPDTAEWAAMDDAARTSYVRQCLDALDCSNAAVRVAAAQSLLWTSLGGGAAVDTLVANALLLYRCGALPVVIAGFLVAVQRAAARPPSMATTTDSAPDAGGGTAERAAEAGAEARTYAGVLYVMLEAARAALPGYSATRAISSGSAVATPVVCPALRRLAESLAEELGASFL